MLSNIRIPDAVIPNGQANSNVFNSPRHHGTAECITIHAPAALDAGTYTLEVNPDPMATNLSSGWVTHQIGDPVADAAPPAIGKGRTYYELAAACSWRIHCTVNAAADRTFPVTISEYVG